MVEELDKKVADAAEKRDKLAAARARQAVLVEALTEAETVMLMVEPRSHKAEYLAALYKARAALAQEKQGEGT